MRKSSRVFIGIIVYLILFAAFFPQPIRAAVGSPCCAAPNDIYSQGGCWNKDESTKPGAKPHPESYTCVAGQELCDRINGVSTCVALSRSPIAESCLDAGGKPILDAEGNPKVNTAIGCVSTSPGELLSTIIRVGIGAGSGIAFLLIILGTFKVMRSQGNPEGINSGKETITAAIIGLIFIILSVSIMQVIGFDILGLGAYGLGAR